MTVIVSTFTTEKKARFIISDGKMGNKGENAKREVKEGNLRLHLLSLQKGNQKWKMVMT